MANKYCENKAIPKHDQPKTSPYTESVTVTFNKGIHRYTVPRQIFERLPTGAATLKDKPAFQIFRFETADEGIGHTVIHWLYTGEYQTLQNPSLRGTAKKEHGYKLAVYAYCAALSYGMTGLKIHARRHMEMFEDALNTGKILAIARELFSQHEGYGVPAAYREYLVRKMVSAVRVNEKIFQQDVLIKSFGQVPEFDRFLMKNMMSLYSLKVSDLQDRLEKAVTQSSYKEESEQPPPYSELPLTGKGH